MFALIGQACKNRWVSLRDQLRRAMKTNIRKSGEATNIKRKWKHEDCMSFLIPFFKERGNNSNIGENTIEDVGEKVLNHLKRSISSSDMHSKTRKTENTEIDSSVLIKYLMKSDKQRSKATSNDPIDIFFKGLAATVKTFSPEYQHMAKAKLFALTSELELAYLQSNNTSFQVPSTSNNSILSSRTETYKNHDMDKYSLPQLKIEQSLQESADSMMYEQNQTPSPSSEGSSL